MQRPLSRTPLLMLALVLVISPAAGAAGAIAFSELDVKDLPSIQAEKDNPPAFAGGPYVQNTTTTSTVIMWQTNKPSRAKVAVSTAQSAGGASDAVTCETKSARCLNEVLVDGLAPDTVYNYHVELADAEANADAQFKTFPVEERPVKFVVYGDSRSRPQRHKLVIDAMAAEDAVDFVINTGDIVGSGWPDEWIPEFFEPARQMIKSVPFFSALGNHENNSPLYFQYYSLPMEERWYSFDVLDIHVVVLDSNMDFDEGSEQYKWLISDLEKYRDKKWKFVVTHHSAFTSGWHGALADDGLPKETPIRVAQKLFPRLAKEYGIAAFFAGHDHHYERSLVDGVHYVISGGGGAPGCKDRGAEVKENERDGVVGGMLHYCAVTVDEHKAKMVVTNVDREVIDTVEITSPVK